MNIYETFRCFSMLFQTNRHGHLFILPYVVIKYSFLTDYCLYCLYIVYMSYCLHIQIYIYSVS